MRTVKVAAPAKVNLFLGIGEKQADGYHAATSLMHALSMHDTLTFVAYPQGTPTELIPVKEQNRREVEEGGLVVTAEVEWHEALPDADLALDENLVVEAVMSLARACGFPWKGRLHFLLEKHIPMQAGLGGGSADAAAALVGAAALWGVEDEELLHRVARNLGVDVPFFLDGGCLLLEGRGDEPVRALEPRHDNVVLLLPAEGVNTAEAYREFDKDPVEVPQGLLKQLEQAHCAADAPLFNNLASASERLLPKLADIRAWASAQPGVRNVLLCGSGSATFAVCDSHRDALAMVTEASAKGYWARSTAFSRLRAAIVPDK